MNASDDPRAPDLDSCDLDTLYAYSVAANAKESEMPAEQPLADTTVPAPSGQLIVKPNPARMETDDDDLDDREKARLWGPPSLEEILKQPMTPPKYILPGLLVKNRNVVVRVDRGVASDMFALLVAAAVSGGLPFEPFGKSEPMVTLVSFRYSDWHLVQEQLSLISNHITDDEDRTRVMKNLHVTHPDQGSCDVEFLNDFWEQRVFRNSIPAECKVIIFPDADMWLTGRKNTTQHKHINSLLDSLNQMGIATLTFFSE